MTTVTPLACFLPQGRPLQRWSTTVYHAGLPEPDKTTTPLPAGDAPASPPLVRRALDQFWTSVELLAFERAPIPRLRAQLAPVVAEARAAAVRPERLVVLLKASWRANAETRGWTHPDSLRGETLLEHAVTAAIEEYFRD